MTPRSLPARVSPVLALRAAGAAAALASSVLVASGCADTTRFSSAGDHFEGSVVGGGFVLRGFPAGMSLCLVLDASHLQDAPGTLTSNDGRFLRTPLRSIPEIWEDPLSTLAFGEGRVQNLVYTVTPAIRDGLGDVTAVLSLMQSGSVEVRLFRGTPAPDGGADHLFGVFPLTRTAGQCSF